MIEYYEYIKALSPHVLQPLTSASTWLTLVHASVSFGLFSCMPLVSRHSLTFYILRRKRVPAKASTSKHIAWCWRNSTGF